jgi:hypothetical protein
MKVIKKLFFGLAKQHVRRVPAAGCRKYFAEWTVRQDRIFEPFQFKIFIVICR